MNLAMLWQFLLMLVGAGSAMQALQPGQELDTGQLGVPPVYVTWQNGNRFIATLHIQRIS